MTSPGAASERAGRKTHRCQFGILGRGKCAVICLNPHSCSKIHLAKPLRGRALTLRVKPRRVSMAAPLRSLLEGATDG